MNKQDYMQFKKMTDQELLTMYSKTPWCKLWQMLVNNFKTTLTQKEAEEIGARFFRGEQMKTKLVHIMCDIHRLNEKRLINVSYDPIASGIPRKPTEIPIPNNVKQQDLEFQKTVRNLAEFYANLDPWVKNYKETISDKVNVSEETDLLYTTIIKAKQLGATTLRNRLVEVIPLLSKDAVHKLLDELRPDDLARLFAILHLNMESGISQEDVDYATKEQDEKKPESKKEDQPVFIPYQVCPKCNGQKYVQMPPNSAYSPVNMQWYGTAISYPCDVCNATGIILMYSVHEDKNKGTE